MAKLIVRRAIATDQEAIEDLVKRERLNPHGIDWPNFQVATLGARIVGTVHSARHYERWGFCVIDAPRAPRVVRRSRLLGQIFGSAMALLHGRAPQLLVILERT